MRTSPRPLRASVLAVGATLLAAAPLAAPTSYADHVTAATTVAAKVQPRSDAWEARVLRLTNDRRAAHGLPPLTASPCADGFAEPWTRHLATKQVLEHQDLGPMLGCPSTSWAGENIAYGYSTPRALVRAWMHSAGHRANILSRHYDRIGVSGWVSTDGVTYATQDFIG